MAVVKNLMVRAGADFSAITTQANKASKSMRGMQSSVSRSCNLMTKAVGGVKKVLGAMGAVLGVAALVNYGKEAAKAYDTQVQGEMKLATVMRKTMGATNGEIQSILDLTAAEQQLGVVGDEVQLAGAQQLSTYLHLSSSLQTLLPVMNDLSVQQYGFNVTEEQAVSVAKLFGKAMEGQTSALTRYGFSVSAAQQQVLKYGTETERAATLADIVRQRVGGMNAALAATPSGRMQQLSNALGDIKERFGQAVRTIGTVFLPVLNAVGSALAGIATIANKVAQAIANVFGGSVAGKEWQWGGVTAGIAETADAVDDLTDAQNGSTAAAKKQKEALQTASFDTLNILRATDAAGGGGGGGGYSGGGGGSSPISETATAAEEAGDNVSRLQQKLEKFKAWWESFRAKLDFARLKTAWGELKEAIGKFSSSVGQTLGAVWKKYLEPLAVWTINKGLPVLLETVAKAISWVAEKGQNLAKLLSGDMSFKEWLQTLSPVEKVLGAVLTAILAVTSGIKIFTTVMAGVKAASAIASVAITALSSTVGIVGLAIIAAGIAIIANWDKISAAAKKYGQAIKDNWNWCVTSIKAGAIGIKDAWNNAVTNIKAGVIGVKDNWNWCVTGIKAGVIGIKDAWNNAVTNIKAGVIGIKDAWNNAVTNIRAGVTRAKDTVSTGLQNLVTSIENIGQKILDGFTSPFKKAYDWIAQIVNKIRNLLNFNWSIPRPKLPQIKWKFDKMNFAGLSIPIPKFSVEWYARGGVFDRASLIGVGENGKEAVVPLERNTGWISKVATELAGQLTGGAGMLGGEALIDGIQDAVYEAMMAALGMQSRNSSHETVLNINGREFFRATWDDYKAVAKEFGVSLINT